MTGLTVVSVDSDLWPLRTAARVPEIRPGVELDRRSSLGEGSFAEVYSVTVRGMAPAVPLALKRFTPGVSDAARTADLIAQLHDRLSARPPGAWLRACVGVPFWSGQVREDGRPPFPALLAVDLQAAGYVSLEEVLDDGCAAILNMDLGDRIELARSFAETAALFEDLHFLHSDINPPNLFVDVGNRRVAVIDVDGGALVGVGSGVPEACGKSDDFLAPELADPTSGAGVDAVTERWSYGIAVSYLLLGTHPLFFLRSLGGQVVEEYKDSFVWPDVDFASDLVNVGIAADYPAWRTDVDQLPGEIAGHFRDLLAGHADTSRRPSALSWALDLQPGPPWFEEISVSTAAVVGKTVEVSWWAPRASSVTVAGISGQPARGRLLVTATASGPIRLEAVNSYGTAEGWTDPIAVFRALPRPPVFQVPPFQPPAVPRFRVPSLQVPAGPHRTPW